MISNSNSLQLTSFVNFLLDSSFVLLISLMTMTSRFVGTVVFPIIREDLRTENKAPHRDWVIQFDGLNEGRQNRDKVLLYQIRDQVRDKDVKSVLHCLTFVAFHSKENEPLILRFPTVKEEVLMKQLWSIFSHWWKPLFLWVSIQD